MWAKAHPNFVIRNYGIQCYVLLEMTPDYPNFTGGAMTQQALLSVQRRQNRLAVTPRWADYSREGERV